MTANGLNSFLRARQLGLLLRFPLSEKSLVLDATDHRESWIVRGASLRRYFILRSLEEVNKNDQNTELKIEDKLVERNLLNSPTEVETFRSTS